MMKFAFPIIALACSAVLLAGTQSVPKAEEQAIHSFLRARFDASGELPTGEIVVTGLAYFRDESELERITDPVLAEFMPDTRFYKALIQEPTGTHSVLVAVRGHGDNLTVRATLQPTYHQRISDGFLLAFLRATATSKLDQERLTRAIGELIISISYGGSVKGGSGGDAETIDEGPPVLSGSFYEVDLWLKNTPQGRESYFATLSLTFDLEGAVESVDAYKSAAADR